MMTKTITAILIAMSVFLLGSIVVDAYKQNQIAMNKNTNQSITAKKDIPMDVTELKIEDTVEGTGSAVKSGDTVVINYTGTLLDGTKFDSSYDRNQPFETQIGVGQVIEGWDKGVVGMKVGGKRKLTIPSSMGYGSRGAGSVIPPNAGLIFEVELVGIK